MPGQKRTRSQGAPEFNQADCTRIINELHQRVVRPAINRAVRNAANAANNGQLVIHPIQILNNILPEIFNHLPLNLREAMPAAIQANPRLLLEQRLAAPQEDEEIINMEDLPRIENYNNQEEREQAIQNFVAYIDRYIQQVILRQLFNIFAQQPAPAAANQENDDAQERPAKRQRIISTLQNGVKLVTGAAAFAAGAYFSGYVAGYPQLSGPVLLLSGIGLKLRANIQNSCSQEARELQDNNNNKRPRDPDGRPGIC